MVTKDKNHTHAQDENVRIKAGVYVCVCVLTETAAWQDVHITLHVINELRENQEHIIKAVNNKHSETHENENGLGNR